MDLNETIELWLSEGAPPADILSALGICMGDNLNEQVAGRDDERLAEWQALSLIHRAIRVLRTGMTEDELMEKGSTLLVAWDKETQ